MALTAVTIDGPAGTLAGWTKIADSPTAPPVVLLHPINLQGKIWADLIELLPDDRSYFAPDVRAHGGSDAAGEFGLDEWLSDILAFIDAMGITEPFHVVGGSLGGSLAVCVAEARPEQVLSVTGMGSSLNFAGVDPNGTLELFDELGVAGAFAKVFPDFTFGPYVTEDMVTRGLALANPNAVEIVKRVWLATVTSDSTPRAAHVLVPALVINGEYDSTCTPALGLEMARALGALQVILPDIGHLPMLEFPERVVPLLEDHFARAESRVTT
jgi:pimeloyl-ACP methyl ester carboxylesterase